MLAGDSLEPMSALPPKADMDQDGCNVRFVPKADIRPPAHPWGSSGIRGQIVKVGFEEFGGVVSSGKSNGAPCWISTFSKASSRSSILEALRARANAFTARNRR